ncbi:MAG TPA: prepilin-type N-terminal cleavage/methylation domain-containing protein [Opitutaceae bacterium]|nr:prepilin-type N-terminal cleavage/methylation domain-containing protein [Opitutaceae bacterium]
MKSTVPSLRPIQSSAFRSSPTAGFSLVELLGVIVLIGIISLGAYIYVGNASQQAIINTKARNAQMLNQLTSIAAATGATIGNGASNNIDTTSVTTAINSLNTGFTVNGIPIKMNPPVGTPASYTMSGTPPTISFASDGSPTTSP